MADEIDGEFEDVGGYQGKNALTFLGRNETKQWGGVEEVGFCAESDRDWRCGTCGIGSCGRWTAGVILGAAAEANGFYGAGG